MTYSDAEHLYIFTTELLIQVSDINYGGHLGNDRFLTLAQEVRSRFFRSKGWTEKNIAHTPMGIVVTEAHIRFLSEGFLGDRILAKLYVSEKKRCQCTFHYELSVIESQKKLSEMSTKVAFFDYEKRKVGKCPEFYEALELM